MLRLHQNHFGLTKIRRNSNSAVAPLTADNVVCRSIQDIAGSRASSESVNLLVCVNAAYVQHVAVCLTSLLANNPDLWFDIIVVGRAGETLDQARLRRSLARFSNHSLSFREFTVPTHPFLPLNVDAYYTLDNWTRLWVEEFFPRQVDRVLYLDSDIVVLGSIAELWHTDLGGALFGAVDIPGSLQGVTNLDMRIEDGYFNSGVLLIDLKQWRESHALETVLRYVESYPERLIDLDQDALNACFYHRRKPLEYRWNATWSFYREPLSIPISSQELNSVREQATIIHFNGNSKPWSYFCDHPHKADYNKYLRMTEWRGFVPRDRTILNRIRKGISAALPEPAKMLLRQTLAVLSNTKTP